MLRQLLACSTWIFGIIIKHSDCPDDGRSPGMSWLHGRAPPGCPQSVGSLKALRCLPPLLRRWPFTFRQDIPGSLPDIEHVNKTAQVMAMPLDLYRLNLLRWRAGGCLAERKRRTPREWSETAKRFKARDRLREARRAAAVERGNPRPPPRMEPDNVESMEPGHTRIPADDGT